MDINQLLSRLDEEAYQEILGREVIGTLSTLGSEYLYAQGLKNILLNTYSNEELLKHTIARNILIKSLRSNEIDELHSLLMLTDTGNKWNDVEKIDFKGEKLQTLFTYFNEVLTVDISADWSDGEFISPGYQLYSYQREVLVKIDSILKTPQNRALLHMPTGSGKTRTTISYICKFLIENEHTNVIWFANTIELLNQAYDEFLKAWSSLGNRELQVVKFWGESTIDLSTLKGAFIVAGLDKTYNSLMTNVGKMSIFANNCKLVVMDEAHQAIAPTYQLLLESMLVVNKASLLGLSATPGRTWNDPSEDKKLAEFFFFQKVKIIIPGYDNPVDYLIEKKYLARTVNTSLLHTSGLSLGPKDIEFLKANFVLPNHILSKIAEDRLRNLAIISKIKQLITKHKRIIVFAITKPHAIVLNSLLTALGINSNVLTSDTSSKSRSKIIDDFKVSRSDNDNALVLCNYGILTTGFDAPEISCAVIARPTDSLVLYSQMVGRAIRGKMSGGNDEAEIVTVIDENLPGFDSTSAAFLNWEDVWTDIN